MWAQELTVPGNGVRDFSRAKSRSNEATYEKEPKNDVFKIIAVIQNDRTTVTKT